MTGIRRYRPVLTVSENIKGVLDVDTVKGCTMGIAANPAGGCYGLCYAHKMAACRGLDFSHSVSRQPLDRDVEAIESVVKNHAATWFRVGTMGDPSHDWPLTLYVCEWLGRFKTPVIVTKHWREVPAAMAKRFAQAGAVFNTSTSPLDTEDERHYRIGQYYRIKGYGVKSILRVVTADFGVTEEGVYLAMVQRWIMMHAPVIDTPLRISTNHPKVLDGTIRVKRVADLSSMSTVSRWSDLVYIGMCPGCPEQCGVTMKGGVS